LQDDNAGNTVTIGDVDFSFFYLFLQAVGLEREQMKLTLDLSSFVDGDTTTKSLSWR
jgi:hypothetical protein